MNTRQIDSVRNKLLRDFREKEKKGDISSFSLLRMLSVYGGSIPVALAKDEHPVGGNQPSNSDSVK